MKVPNDMISMGTLSRMTLEFIFKTFRDEPDFIRSFIKEMALEKNLILDEDDLNKLIVLVKKDLDENFIRKDFIRYEEKKCNCGGYGSFPNPTKPPCPIHMSFLAGQENE